eukprot:NODE_1638_length_1462_cov_64.396320_g1479_i0.p1 GENE.NODE_1638_length_1462_cov_64.396320_g1479_i0~~NODE_1638_length_1462_cov_64.396320_g1479_i0.p1  ORF type:complete len:411 (+),score=60.15 NODE_1638_length_1462_cov_64.396320_g1479_i0:195-1427(+)
MKSRQACLERLHTMLSEFASVRGERVLRDPRNDISLALTLDTIREDQVTALGSQIFYRNITGPRVVRRGTQQTVCKIPFSGYGSHCNEFPHSYLALACAIGITNDDIDSFFKRLEAVWRSLPPSKLSPTAVSEVSASSLTDAKSGEPVSNEPPPDDEEIPPPSVVKGTLMSGAGWCSEHWSRCGSTMDVARVAVQRHPEDFVLVSADLQTQGRGTKTREWLSPNGNVFMTLAVRDSSLAHSRLHLLPLETALVVLKTIQTVSKMNSSTNCPPVQLKWPNDVVIAKKKVAGCLIENSSGYFFIGVGINVQVAPPVKDEGRQSGCLQEFGMQATALDLREEFVRQFASAMSSNNSGPELIKEWRSLVDWSLEMRKRDGSLTEVRGVDVNDFGNLIVRHEDGTQETLVADYLW